jgi:hypothetical protein
MFQLSFLNASLLLFTAASILPLLIWLLAKKKPLKVVFPTLRFIKLSKEQEKSRSKLKNILLLIIRMLIILLVALAVARPMFRSARLKPSKKHPPTALAILLDTSYSMEYAESGKSYLQYAKEAIAKINAKTTEADRLILISSNENWNQLNSQIYAGKLPQSVIEQIGVTYSPLPVNEMLALAERKLQESQMPNQEIYLISDMRMDDIKLKASVPIASIPLPESQSYENIACTSAIVLPMLVDKKKQQTIRFTLENHGSADRKDVLVKVVIKDVKVAEKFVSVPARQSISETIVCDVHSDGWQSGYIEVMDERQTFDNRCYFAFPFYSKPSVAVISRSAALPAILSSMLSVYTNATPNIINPDALSISALENYQMIILYEPGIISSRLQEVLAAVKNRNQGILVCMGNNLDSSFKAYLKSSFDVEIKERSINAITINQLSKHHYISSLISDKPLKNGRIANYWLAAATKVNSLISSNNTPLAIQNGKQALWLWNIASMENTFFMDPAFPVLAFRTFDYISNTEIEESSGSLGDVLSFNSLRMPNGEMLTSRRHTAVEPGIYILEPGSPKESAVAINTDYKDSQNRKNIPTGIKSLGKDWENKLFLSRLGHDMWKSLLAIAFALVILELIIVKIEESRVKA